MWRISRRKGSPGICASKDYKVRGDVLDTDGFIKLPNGKLKFVFEITRKMRKQYVRAVDYYPTVYVTRKCPDCEQFIWLKLSRGGMKTERK